MPKTEVEVSSRFAGNLVNTHFSINIWLSLQSSSRYVLLYWFVDWSRACAAPALQARLELSPSNYSHFFFVEDDVPEDQIDLVFEVVGGPPLLFVFVPTFLWRSPSL